MTDKLTIALDVDGVLADCASAVHANAIRILRANDLPRPEFWHSFDFSESMDLSEENAKSLFGTLLREDCLGWQIALYEGAAKFVFELLASGHDVFFVTAQWEGMPSWVPAREALLRRYFPQLEVVFTHAKQRCVFDLLIEDRAMTAAKVGVDRCVLIDRPWNKLNRPAGVLSAANYSEMLELVALLQEQKQKSHTF